MDNQNQIAGTKKKIWPIVVATVVLLLLIGGWFVWNNYLSPNAQRQRQLQENIDKYNSFISTFEAAMKADTYGGKTPQETLNMFIDALKKGDIDLASKYFALDTNEKSPDYLTRKKWENSLNETKKDGGIDNLISLLEKATPAGSSMAGYFGFEVRDNTAKLIGDIGMQLNKYSQVWKIESM